MNEKEFINKIYNSIKVGTKIRKPRTVSIILEIRENGDIHYTVGNNKRYVTKNELRQTYKFLFNGHLTNKDLGTIVPAFSPCNKTSITGILEYSGLVKKNADRTFTRQW